MLRAVVVLTTLLLASPCSVKADNAPATCADDPCLNGGQCEDDANGFICHCTLKFIGDRCQFQATIINTTICLKSSESMDNDSLCAKAVDGSDENGLSSEWVIDGSKGGIGAYIVLHLVDAYSVIGVKYLQRCEPQDQFKKLIVTLNDGTMEFSNATCSASASACDENKWETLFYDSAKSGIYLLKITVLQLCTSEVQTPVGFRDIVVLGTNDECTTSTPCLNGGICNELDFGYECDCSGTGFEGENCEHNIDDCVNADCGTGSCVDLINGYECSCIVGFTGAHCETNIDDCDPDPCVHGSCTDGVNSYSCTCEPGWEGTNCDVDTDECLSSPCVHGNCTNLANAYNCTCIPGYEGDRCQTDINECLSNPCVHGSCTNLLNRYSCVCDEGYEGTNCDIDIDDCADVVCQNGGSCVDQVNGYQCLCADGTEGTLCTDPEDLECSCSLNGTTLDLDVFDEPDLMVYSTGQKTILSSYKLYEHDPCKFEFQSVTMGSTAPAPLSAITFNIGKHPKNPRKFYRSYKVNQTKVSERGVGKKKEKEVTLPYCWTARNNETNICLERVGDVIQFRSTKCPYALDVDVSTLSGTLYIEKTVNWPLMGMCGDCDDQWNGYVLANGTSVDDVTDEQERFQLITKSYIDLSRARRH